MVRSYPVIDRDLAEMARTSTGLSSWRRAALDRLRLELPFDAALFHELSPRVPLDRGALIGIDRSAFEERGDWDENAVLFGRLRDLALAQAGVAIDREAFTRGSVPMQAWQARVLRRLKIATAMLAHLEVRSRIVSVVMIARRRGRFTLADRAALTSVVPTLAACDALVQHLERGVSLGPPRALECVDQRLTDRQRELVLLVALGHTNAEIARALAISENTVRNALVTVRAKLGAANRAEIVRLAVLR
jgi:DNA-binding CsgD family transcriptional regulator